MSSQIESSQIECNQLESAEDFAQLINRAPVVVITSYRGDWCPFCRKYLSEFERERQNFPDEVLIVGVSVDSPEANTALKSKLGLGFDIVSDQQLLMHDLFNVTIGKKSGNTYLQPSVLIFKDGEKHFEWIQTPKLLNLGGAVSRIPVTDVIAKAVQAVC